MKNANRGLARLVFAGQRPSSAQISSTQALVESLRAASVQDAFAPRLTQRLNADFATAPDASCGADATAHPEWSGGVERRSPALPKCVAEMQKVPATNSGDRDLDSRTPYGIRTRAAGVKGRCPRPLNEGGLRHVRVPRSAAGSSVGHRPPGG